MADEDELTTPIGLFNYADSYWRSAVRRAVAINDKIHRDFTADGKARLHRYVQDYAMREDLVAVVDVIKALRFYLCLPQLGNQ